MDGGGTDLMNCDHLILIELFGVSASSFTAATSLANMFVVT